MRLRSLLPLVALALLAGCGGGSGGSGGGTAASSRAEARFDVDVKTGKVTITPTAGRAVYQGSAVSFTSSDLLSVGGDAGQRLIRVTAKNNSGESWGGAPVRLTVSDVTNAADAALRASVQVTTYAGTGAAGGADGYRTDASTGLPSGICVGAGPLAGSLIVANGNAIRRIHPDGMVSTLAGDYATSGIVDAVGAAARFNLPRGVACDPWGNVFVGDSANNRIRRITPTGEVTTIAGTGVAGDANGAANAATFNLPCGVAVSADGNRLFTSECGSNKIRRVEINSPSLPRHLAASYTVYNVAGPAPGSISVGLVDGLTTTARFNSPTGLGLLTTATGEEVLFVADTYNNAIRRIDSPGGSSATVCTIIGNGNWGDTDGLGSVARLRYPRGVVTRLLSQGDFALFITDEHRCREALFPAGGAPTQKGSYTLTTLAGASAGGAGYADGDGGAALFYAPFGVAAVGAGNGATLYVTDSQNRRIREVTVPGGALHSGGAASAVTEPIRVVNAETATANRTAWQKQMTGVTGADPAWSADVQFYIPNGVSGFSFLASIETDSNLVSIPAAGALTLTTLAGNGSPDTIDGPGRQARLNQPFGVVAVPPAMRSLYRLPGGGAVRAFVTDPTGARIRYLDTAGNLGSWAGSTSGHLDGVGTQAQFGGPLGIALAPDGSLIVLDVWPSYVRRVWPNGQVTTVAGAGAPGSTDGPGDLAAFSSAEGVVVSPGGRIYVSDTGNHTIREIALTGADPRSASSYTVRTIAGTAGAAGYGDGDGPSARFNFPGQIAMDIDGNLLVTDSNNNAVRKITFNTSYSRTVSTPASGFAQPKGIAIDAAQNIWVVDVVGSHLRRLNPQGGGLVTLLGGSEGFSDGPSGTLRAPRHLAVEASGAILITDQNNNALRCVQRLIADAAP